MWGVYVWGLLHTKHTAVHRKGSGRASTLKGDAPRRDREMAGGWLAVGAKDASGMVVWRPATLQEDGQRAAAASTSNHRVMGCLQKGMGEGKGNLVASRQFLARKGLNRKL